MPRAAFHVRFLLWSAALLAGIGCLSASAAREHSGLSRRVKPVEPPVQHQRPDLRAQLVQTTSLIRADEARSRFAVNGNGLTVAVLDTGLRVTHQDFVGRVAAVQNFTADDGGDPANVTDLNGHGTNVTGIIAANAVHVGIAPGADVIALKVLDNNGGGDFNAVAAALDAVIANRAGFNITVVNMSLGDGGNHVSLANDSIQQRIQTLRNAGVAVCVAAGNDFFTHNSAQGMGYPSIFSNTVSVGAVFDANIGGVRYGSGAEAFITGARLITPFTQRLHPNVNTANRTDIFAPGAPLTASGSAGDTASSTQHGTSQATPVIAGVILLLQERHKFLTGGALPTVDQLEKWLRDGAVVVTDGDDENDNVTNTGLQFPVVDAVKAMEAMEADLAGTTFSISGTVTQNGAGLGGVTVSAGGKSATTATNGTYSISGLAAGTFSVVPSKSGVTFTPTSRSVTLGPSATGIDFSGTADQPTTFSISGTVTLNGAGLGSVSVTAGGQTVTTGANGAYTISNLAAGTYTVTPSRTGFAFSPTAQTVTVGPSQSGINFTATQTAFSISGTVTEDGAGVSGVTVSVGSASATTGSNGSYTISGLAAGTYTVTPSGTGLTFTPASQQVTVGPDQTGVNFTASSGPVLESFVLNKSVVKGKKKVVATVIFSDLLTENTLITFTSSNPLVVRVPSSAVLRAGFNAGRLKLKTRKVKVPTDVILTATANGVSKSVVLTVIK